MPAGTDLPPGPVEFSQALVSACCEMGLGLIRDPEASADVLVNAASMLQG